MARGRGGSSLNVHSRGSQRGRGFRGRSSYRGGRGGRGGASGGQPNNNGDAAGAADAAPAIERGDDGTRQEERFEETAVRDEIDNKLGFARYEGPAKKDGWLVNMHPVGTLAIRLCALLTVHSDYSQRPRLADWPRCSRLLLPRGQWRQIQDYL